MACLTFLEYNEKAINLDIKIGVLTVIVNVGEEQRLYIIILPRLKHYNIQEAGGIFEDADYSTCSFKSFEFKQDPTARHCGVTYSPI